MQVILQKLTNLEKKWDKKMAQFNSVVEMFSSQTDDVTNLKTKVKELQERVEALEKSPKHTVEEKHREVVITNVPPLLNENTKKVAEAVFRAIQVDLGEGDVQLATRFETKTEQNKKYFLKVRLATSEAKGKVIKAARSARANLQDLQLCQKTKLTRANESTFQKGFITAPIFINEAVSKSTRLLMQSAIKLKKEQKIHTVWSYQDRVFIRKETKSKPVMINSEEDLKALGQN